MQEIQKTSRLEFFFFFCSSLMMLYCFFINHNFVCYIVLAEPKKDRSAEIMFKRMEELTSGNESASNQVKLKELPLFEFQVLATATDSFSLRNKLGQGGFGPVYKVNASNKNQF